MYLLYCRVCCWSPLLPTFPFFLPLSAAAAAATIATHESTDEPNSIPIDKKQMRACVFIQSFGYITTMLFRSSFFPCPSVKSNPQSQTNSRSLSFLSFCCCVLRLACPFPYKRQAALSQRGWNSSEPPPAPICTPCVPLLFIFARGCHLGRLLPLPLVVHRSPSQQAPSLHHLSRLTSRIRKSRSNRPRPPAPPPAPPPAATRACSRRTFSVKVEGKGGRGREEGLGRSSASRILR